MQARERVRLPLLVRLLRPRSRLSPPGRRVARVPVRDLRLGPDERRGQESRLAHPERELRPEVAREVRARDAHASDARMPARGEEVEDQPGEDRGLTWSLAGFHREPVIVREEPEDLELPGVRLHAELLAD